MNKLFAIAALALTSGTAFAHTELEASTPADEAVLDAQQLAQEKHRFLQPSVAGAVHEGLRQQRLIDALGGERIHRVAGERQSASLSRRH